MQNRVSTYPGRVRLVPVSGQENVYDMTRADEPTQVGTPLNKETFLSDPTAALYPGLDGDSTPNDAFAFLGNYTQWRWNRRTVKWTENQGEETSVYYSPSSSSQNVVSASYSDAISFDPSTGSVSLVSPSSMVSNANNVYENMTPLKGKYLKLKDDNVYFAGDNYEIEVTHYGGGGISIYIKGLLPISANKSTGPWEEVRASTNGAYPNSGIHDGYEYVALGMPLENAKNRIPVIGSYTGTGVYGEENKNHISLPGKPLCILIFANKESSRMFISCESDSGTAVFSSATDDYFNNVYSFDNNGNDLYWYCNYGGSAGGGTGSNASAYGQLNSSGVKYNYIALYGGV